MPVTDSDMVMVLTELKHIREVITDNKTDLKEFKDQYKQDMKELKENDKCIDCHRIALIEFRLKSYEELVVSVKNMNNSGGILVKIFPWIMAFIAWLIGGGWRFFGGV